MAPTTKCSTGSNLVSVTVFEIFRVKILTVHLLTLVGLTPEPKVTKRETTYYPPRSTILQNFSPVAQTVYEICATKYFHFLAPGGLTPGPKFTKREMIWGTPNSTILQNDIALRQPTSEISVTKILRTKKKTNRQTNSKRYIHNTQHAYRHVWITNRCH